MQVVVSGGRERLRAGEAVRGSAEVTQLVAGQISFEHLHQQPSLVFVGCNMGTLPRATTTPCCCRQTRPYFIFRDAAIEAVVGKVECHGFAPS